MQDYPKRDPNRKGYLVLCDCCDSEIYRPDWRFNRCKTFLCGDCYQNTKVELECAFCGSFFLRYRSNVSEDKNYCSRRCSGKGISKDRYSNEDAYSGVFISCSTCGEELYREPNQVDGQEKHYCSRSCFAEGHREHMRGSNNPAWRGGSDPYYGPRWGEQRKACLERDKYTCVECGIDQDTLGESLHVHHKTPLRKFNRDFKRANSLDNLVSLCRTCHITVEWRDNNDR